jgi:hypothetical protein
MSVTMSIITMIFAAALQGTQPAIRTLDRGDQSNVDDARQTVARTAAEFDRLWQLHAPDRQQPRVDFSKEMVAGVFLGSRPTAGFGITIVGTREESAALVVQYRETRPARGLITAQVITSAYHIVALPTRAGDVKFERID